MAPELLIRENLTAVQARIAEAARRSGRSPGAVSLVAVTKRRPAHWSRWLADCGVWDHGENYPQELWSKVEALGDAPIHWHLIGHLQGNKARKTLPMVRMIHGVDSLKLLRSLDELAGTMAAPAAVCLQVNVSEEATKHGWSAPGLLADADAIAECRRLPIVGLMTMAAPGPSAESARPAFAALRGLRDDLRAGTGLELPGLSMGMSQDYEVAVEEGATWVRVGSALFEGVEG